MELFLGIVTGTALLLMFVLTGMIAFRRTRERREAQEALDFKLEVEELKEESRKEAELDSFLLSGGIFVKLKGCMRKRRWRDWRHGLKSRTMNLWNPGTVRATVVRENTRTLWVQLPDGNVIKRKKARDVV